MYIYELTFYDNPHRKNSEGILIAEVEFSGNLLTKLSKICINFGKL